MGGGGSKKVPALDTDEIVANEGPGGEEVEAGKVAAHLSEVAKRIPGADKFRREIDSEDTHRKVPPIAAELARQPDGKVEHSFVWYSAAEEGAKSLPRVWEEAQELWHKIKGHSKDPNVNIEWIKRECYGNGWVKGVDYNECPLDSTLPNRIKEFPTLRLYSDTGEDNFQGDRTVPELLNFVRGIVDPPELKPSVNPGDILENDGGSLPRRFEDIIDTTDTSNLPIERLAAEGHADGPVYNIPQELSDPRGEAMHSAQATMEVAKVDAKFGLEDVRLSVPVRGTAARRELSDPLSSSMDPISAIACGASHNELMQLWASHQNHRRAYEHRTNKKLRTAVFSLYF